MITSLRPVMMCTLAATFFSIVSTPAQGAEIEVSTRKIYPIARNESLPISCSRKQVSPEGMTVTAKECGVAESLWFPEQCKSYKYYGATYSYRTSVEISGHSFTFGDTEFSYDQCLKVKKLWNRRNEMDTQGVLFDVDLETDQIVRVKFE